MSSVAMFAANEHYTADKTNCQFATKLNCIMYIDGVLQGDNEGFGDNMEIVAFDQNGLCRGAKRPLWNRVINAWYYQMQLWGFEGLCYTFMVYDNETGEMLPIEFENVEFGQEIYAPTFCWQGNIVIGNGTSTPAHINFTSPVQEPYTLDIIGYGEGEGGYYLIASPVTDNITPSADNGFITDTYDLYYFDQATDGNNNEWITFKEGSGATNPNFAIENGKGYLYASHENTTLTFNGTLNSDGVVDLTYVPGNSWTGWNLVGNPFNATAYIDRSFYAMQNGNELTPCEAGVAIGKMDGIFVCAENEDDNSLTFSTTAPNAKSATLTMNVTKGRSLSDRAIVCFGGKQALPKFQLRQNSTKVYIPVEGTDYAVVSAEAIGELPVNFRPEKSGDYTLNFSAENVSFTYLHLIDNKTGANVDLLQTPTYSFNASTTDYASRFRLQFATGNSVDGDNFGFINEAGNLTIFGIEGTATLQVIDVNGRILSNETFSGSYEKQLNVSAGIYMLRLVNGNDVMVQKMVVK